MLCPKCGREVDDSAAICSGCDFILDTSFLGEDITDDESEKRVRKRRRKGPPAAESDYGEDALILGDLGDEIDSFQSTDTGFVQRELTNARVYIGGVAQRMLSPDSIPVISPGITLDTVRLTPFERHVLEYVNGKRPVARIKKKAGLDEDELRTALATLTDKGFLRLAGKAKRKRPRASEPTRVEDVSRSGADATVVSEIPSSMLVDLAAGDAAEAEEDGGVFAEETEQAGLLSDAPEPEEDIHREVTLIQKLPAPASDDGSFASAEERALSYADSLVSEEPVFAASQAASAEKARRKGARKDKKERRRRPPLPGEVDPAELRALPTGPLAAPAPPTGPVDVPAHNLAIPPPLPSEALRSAEGAPYEVDDLLAAEGARFEDGALTGAEHPQGPLDEFPSAVPTQPPDEPISIDVDEPDSADFDETVAVEPEEPVPVEPEEPVPVRPDEISLKIVLEPSAAATPPPEVFVPPPGLPPLPGQGVPPLPGQAPAGAPPAAPIAPLGPAAPPETTARPPGPALDDDDIDHESDEGEPVADAGGVPFEMRRKAEKIFEQAERDIAEGRVSSALMNAKLAAIYNPHDARYQKALHEWEDAKSSRPARRSPQQDLVEQAQQAEARGNYQQAADLLQQALDLDPRAAALHNRLGVLLATRLKRYHEASASVMRAIELNPSNPAYKNNLGKILAKEEDEIERQGIKPKKKNKNEDDGAVIVKKLRPKLF